ncbi:unnamed protein product [Mycena citricolor]|uniref:MFS general substrate transporter n=1 Tax=Mycena citricolor TaxID=2018698 RepID=A0AAD2HDY6_9AGAR|nr:unnamed protein product [Mycena citricolor]
MPTLNEKHNAEIQFETPECIVERKQTPLPVHVLPEAALVADGGREAWGTVVASFLVMFCSFGYSSSFGVYQDFYARTYLDNYSSSSISWIGSVNIFILLSGGFAAGRLHDQGYFYYLMFGGCLLTSLSLFMLSLAQPNHFYQVFLTQGVANGIGAGMTYVPCMAVLSHHFQKRRALAMSIVASGSSLGAVIHPIMLNHTLHSGLSFGNAVRVSAGLISGLLLFACLLFRTRLAPPKQTIHLRHILVKFARDKAYVTATLGLCVYTVGFYYPLFYLQLDAVQHDLDPSFAFNALVIMNSSSFLGRLAPGFFAGRLNPKTMMAISTACGAILILAMMALRNIASVVTIGVLYGFCAGCSACRPSLVQQGLSCPHVTVVTLVGPLFASLTDDMSELGARLGLCTSLSGLGILIGPPLDGMLLTDKFYWWRPALFSGIMAAVGCALFLLMFVLHRKKRAAGVVVELALVHVDAHKC